MGKVSSSCAPPLVLVLRSRRSCDPLSNLVWHLGNWCPLLPRLAAYVGSCGTLGEVLRRRQPSQNAHGSAAKRVAAGMRKPVPQVPAIQHPATQMRRKHHSSSKRIAQLDRAKQEAPCVLKGCFKQKKFFSSTGRGAFSFWKKENGGAQLPTLCKA